MKVIAEFPQEIFEQHDVRIPLADGSELSARIWRPSSPEPVPAIVEYIPYRQRDLTAVRTPFTTRTSRATVMRASASTCAEAEIPTVFSWTSI